MAEPAGRLLSVNVGMPRDVAPCETGLASGEISYRPDPLERPAPGTALICCSQPRGETALDLLPRAARSTTADRRRLTSVAVLASPSLPTTPSSRSASTAEM